MLRFGSVPTLLMASTTRSAIQSAQQRLMETQQEASTGRHYDLGLTLGGRVGEDIGLRMRLEGIQRSHDNAAQAAVKADVAQSTLGAIGDLALSFQNTLLGARNANGGQDLARQAAAAAFEAFSNLMNTTLDGRYLFAGLNTDTAPLRDFSGGTPEAAIDAVFLAHFGMTQNDPGVSQITAASMDAFIGGAFGNVFSPSAWKSDWSTASDGNLMQRTSDGSLVDVAFNSNSAFVPKLAEALSMITSLGQGSLSSAAFEVTVNKAMVLLVDAQQDIGAEQSRLGVSQQILNASSASAEQIKSSALKALRALEEVDPYEAATRVNTLMTQLESSYAITGRISRMSLLNYI